MMRSGRNPRVNIAHERDLNGLPKPSTASLWLILDGKREDVVEVPMTLADLLALGEDTMRAAKVLMRTGAR